MCVVKDAAQRREKILIHMRRVMAGGICCFVVRIWRVDELACFVL